MGLACGAASSWDRARAGRGWAGRCSAPSPLRPQGSSWLHVGTDQPFASVSIGGCHQVWAVARDGSAFYRGSVSPSQPAGECRLQEAPPGAATLWWGWGWSERGWSTGLLILSSAPRASPGSTCGPGAGGPAGSPEATPLPLGPGGGSSPHPSWLRFPVCSLLAGQLVAGSLHVLPRTAPPTVATPQGAGQARPGVGTAGEAGSPPQAGRAPSCPCS